MRLYTFTNYYLSSIQVGIQTAHIQGELTNRVFDEFNNSSIELLSEKAIMTIDWAKQHKTIIACNGGNAKSLRDLIIFFNSCKNPYPHAYFNEDDDSLDCALTGVGIILPEEIYDVDTITYEDGSKKFVYRGNINIGYSDSTSYIFKLIEVIKSAPLAR